MRFILSVACLAFTVGAVAPLSAKASDVYATSGTPRIGGAPTADLASLLRNNGLLDPSRLTTWRSYSFGVSSGPNGTTSAGLLVQHLRYQLSKPLTLHVELGLLHDPVGMAGLGSKGNQQASLFVPAVDLIYRPRENMVVSFHYSQTPSGLYRSGFGTPWWENPGTNW